MNEKVDLKSLRFEQLADFVRELGEPAFRTKQIFEWLYRGVLSFDEMTNLSKALRAKLEERAFINRIEIEKKLVSSIDGTIKYLYRMMDGECVETVLMRYTHGNSICLSTEVGCAMGCAFCASTIGGLKRRLAASEIIDQVLMTEKDTGERVDSIVLMGIGEPLDNFESVAAFLHNINHPSGLNIGMRHISLSTCGLVPRIRQLEQMNLPITLSVSLHATDNETRDKIMPVNHKYRIEELLAACRSYAASTRRRITFEFAIISGVNDELSTAKALAELLRGMLCHVNIIPVNPVTERGFVQPDRPKIDRFADYLNQHGIPATVRRRLGADINASCGQLRRKREKRNEEETV